MREVKYLLHAKSKFGNKPTRTGKPRIDETPKIIEIPIDAVIQLIHGDDGYGPDHRGYIYMSMYRWHIHRGYHYYHG